MAANKNQDLDRPGVRHEERDVNTWAVGKFAIALVLLCGVALLILAGLFKFFQAREQAEDHTPGSIPTENRNPPAPRLQIAPVQDLKAMRAGEDAILNGVGWVDQKNGIARIPIERAIDLLAQRGLPARQEAPAKDTVTVPTESGLGEVMQQPGGPLAAEPSGGPVAAEKK